MSSRALEQKPIGIRQVVHVIPASDWRARQHWSLSGANKLTDIGEAGQPPHMVIDEKGEALPAPARMAGFYRATDELLRNAGRNTDLETALARAMIEAANETLRSVIGAKIATPGNLSDGAAVFDSTRGTDATTPALPDVASLSAARVGLERQVDGQGTLRPVEPAILLVAPEQRTAAEKVVADLAAAEVDEVNPFTGRLRVVSGPALAGTGAAGHWYVLGDPAGVDGLALIVLDDMPAPRIEARESWTQFGMEWRIQWPMAAAWVRRSWFRTQIPQG